MVICLERGADLHMDQLMPLPLTVSCDSKIQIGFSFLVPDHPGSPRQRAIKWVCVFQVLKNSEKKVPGLSRRHGNHEEVKKTASYSCYWSRCNVAAAAESSVELSLWWRGRRRFETWPEAATDSQTAKELSVYMRPDSPADNAAFTAHVNTLRAFSLHAARTKQLTSQFTWLLTYKTGALNSLNGSLQSATDLHIKFGTCPDNN